MQSHRYQPSVTFEDTNIVGNIYFRNYLRWQIECRDEWLRAQQKQLFQNVFKGCQRIFVTQLSTRFRDQVGATIGDRLEVIGCVEPAPGGGYAMSAEIRKCGVEGASRDGYSTSAEIRKSCCSSPGQVATGHQTFFVASNYDHDSWKPGVVPDAPRGPAYLLPVSVMLQTAGRLDVLDLFRWQGRCRERFLLEHAPDALQLVSNCKIALHTSSVDVQFLDYAQLMPFDEIAVEMRLLQLRGGRMTVRFDFFRGTSSTDLDRRTWFASGRQEMCCKTRTPTGLAPGVFPADMLEALYPYAPTDQVRANIDTALEFLTNEPATRLQLGAEGNRLAIHSSDSPIVAMELDPVLK
jgi:enediyne core biosynthesis thioesterase